MTVPLPFPANEIDRLRAVEEHGLLDTTPEDSFDDLAALAAEICEAPLALITLVHEDRQWIKARVGTSIEETRREISFCTHAICQPEIFIVPDALEDARFAQNPLVTQDPSIRFYAGAPLLSREGYAVGTLCVLDRIPRELTEYQQRALRVLSRHVCTQLELRRADTLRRLAEEAAAKAQAELERRVLERTAQLQVAVQQAEAAKTQIASMVERMSDGLLAFDHHWRFDYVNGKAAELLGFTSVNLIGKGMLEVLPESIGLPLLAMCQRAVEQQTPQQMEAFYEPRGRSLECRCYPSPEGTSIFLQDITSRQKAESNWKRERDLSEAIIGSLPGTFYLFDEEGQYIRWNEEAVRTTGLTEDQYRRTAPLDKIFEADQHRVAQGIRQVFANGDGRVEARIVHASGEARWHLLTGRSLWLEGKRCLVGIGIDISDRKAAEQALSKANNSLEIAIAGSGVGLWDWDAKADTVAFSLEYKRQLGYSEEEYPNEHASWQARIHPEDHEKLQAYMSVFFEKSLGDYNQEYRMRHRDGNYRWIMSRARLFRDEQGHPERMLGCHIDVTERRAMEDALLTSREQIRALVEHQNLVREEEAGRIARELHDELGAALTGLKIDLSWVDRRVAGIDEAVGEAIRGRLQRIDQQLDDTISSVRKVCQALRPAVLDQLGLTDAIDWQCAEFRSRTGVECVVIRDDTIAIESAKSIAIFRILQELLTNVSRHAHATQVTVEAFCRKTEFHLVVSDNGVGLPNDALRRANHFGLVGVQERVLASNGTVHFEARPEGGTVIRVCLPSLCEEKA